MRAHSHPGFLSERRCGENAESLELAGSIEADEPGRPGRAAISNERSTKSAGAGTSRRREPKYGRCRGARRGLRRCIEGEVRFSDGDRGLYATDASNYRQMPIGVVLPRHADDVVATVSTAREFGAPVLMRGAGTSLAGQTCNVAVVIDNSKYFNRILDLDVEARRARVEPGLVLDDLRSAADQHGLTYGPDPATHNRCTLGGMLGNNSCGVHSVMAEFYGHGPMTVDQVDELEVLTYDGARFTVKATDDAEYEQIIRAGGRKGEIHAALRDLRDRHADEIRRRYARGLLRWKSGPRSRWIWIAASIVVSVMSSRSRTARPASVLPRVSAPPRDRVKVRRPPPATVSP